MVLSPDASTFAYELNVFKLKGGDFDPRKSLFFKMPENIDYNQISEDIRSNVIEALDTYKTRLENGFEPNQLGADGDGDIQEMLNRMRDEYEANN